MLAIVALVQSLMIAVSGPPTAAEYLPIHVAAAGRYFAEEGLAVSLVTTGSEAEAAEALTKKSADLAATSLAAALRFVDGKKGGTPRLVFGLTAAPPVVLGVTQSAANTVRTLADLRGTVIGLASPGAPEAIWLAALLNRYGMRPTSVAIESLGERRLGPALSADTVSAALVRDPTATRLLAAGVIRALVDLRDQQALAGILGHPTVNAGVFVRPGSRLSPDQLEAVCRALLRAVARIQSAPPTELARPLSKAVRGLPSDFGVRLEATRAIYLKEGVADEAAVLATIKMIRAATPLGRVPNADAVLDLGPLRRALTPTRAP